MSEEKKQTVSLQRPPIVAVLGHVDHGKTSLLDTIRKTHVTDKEAGGITQHIGAYQIAVGKGKDKAENNLSGKITFIDTPGHEAFAKMRSRGSQTADLALLVVAATEGVKPQTEESIKHIKEAGIPMIVVLNKMDLPEANIDKVNQQLAKSGVLIEKFGGDVVVLPVSAKTGKGIPELLDAILLVAEMKGNSADAKGAFSGIVIEAKMDKSKGPLATIIVKNGTLKVGSNLYTDTTEARVRQMLDSTGAQVKEAFPGMPVEIMGWKQSPQVGTEVTQIKAEKVEAENRFQARDFSLPPLEEIKKLKMVLKADVSGTLEAIRESFPEGIEIVHAATGEILESDILLAKSTGSVVIGFNVKPNAKIVEFAKAEKVKLKVYSIIYELLDEIGEVVTLLNKPEAQEQVLGEATILAEFGSKDARVVGCKVESGRLVQSDQVKLMRGAQELGRGRIKTLKQGKVDTNKAESGTECGLTFDKKLDFKIGDRIIAFKQQELLS